MELSENEKKIDQLTQQLNKQKIDYALVLSLIGKPFPNNGFPAEINILTAKAVMLDNMAKKGITIGFNEHGFPEVKQIKDGILIDYFVDNKKIDIDSYTTSVLIENKFIQSKETSGQNAQPNQQGQGLNFGSGNGQAVQFANKQGANAHQQDARAQLQELGYSSNPVVAEIDHQLSQLGFK